MRAIIATSLILALGAGTAQAAPVVVVKPDGKPKQRINLEQRQSKADVHEEEYVIQNNQGKRIEEVERGFSIRRILGLAGVPRVKGYVSIAGMGRVLLDRPNLRADAYGDQHPVFYLDDERRVVFLRPQRTTGDKNAQDVFSAREGANLEIVEHEGQLLKLTIDASDTKVDPGDTVTFTAELKQPSGYSLESEIAWTATGLEAKTGRNVVYKFPDEATAEVSASVTDDNGNRGEDTVEIQVGDPVESDTNQDGGGINSNPYAPDTGPYYGVGGSTPPDIPDLPDTSPKLPDVPRVKAPGPIDNGVEVTGELLSETGPYIPPPPEELVGARAGTPDDGASWTVPGIGLGASLVVGLLGFGAGREFERLPMRRLRNLLPF